MRVFAVAAVVFVVVITLLNPASGQSGISITGADQVRDLASVGSSGVPTAAAEVTARIEFDSPNLIRIVPLPTLPEALVVALAEVPYRLYLPVLVR